jgi:probable rRNA maturation factor
VPAAEVRRLVTLAVARAGVRAGHVAVAFVDPDAIARLNAEHRGKQGPTDVLSFPVDGAGPVPGPSEARELGDIVICPPHTTDLREAVVHGALHLVGFDHETDDGEMLALQDEIMGGLA